MQIEDIYARFCESKGVSTDTRTLQPGELFFALSGENHDGNTYVNKALELNASHVICTDATYAHNDRVTVVEDSLAALQKLATYHRNQLKAPIVALTGSNGKTTTKELIISVLRERFNVTGTVGNFNNHIGVPLTLLSFTEHTEVGVVEMGANHQREIAALCEIARPDIGLITNFGKAHLEGFGGIEGVKKGKSELYDFLRANHKKAIIRPQDEEQVARTAQIDRSLAPSFTPITVQPITFQWDEMTVETQVTGSYNVANMELAAAVGLELNLSQEQIARGLSSYVPQNNRSQILEREQYTIIKDAYNANPTSMRAALMSLSKVKKPRMAILGDMFELGIYASQEHEDIIALLEELGIEEYYVIGENFYRTTAQENRKFKDYIAFDQFINHLEIKPYTTILLKGSRGMALERALDKI